MELRWQASVDVSAMHAAWVVAVGRQLFDEALQQELHAPVKRLSSQFSNWSFLGDHVWRQLIALSADVAPGRSLAERLSQRLLGGQTSPAALSELASALSECSAVMRRRFPNLLAELSLRTGPLQTAWEARGPGMLARISDLTDDEFLVESAVVLLVQPVVGGDGMAHLMTNRIHIEALLTDAQPQLPETLRVAWLLGQLNLDRPLYGEQVHGLRLSEVAEHALLPVVLSAAEFVQLTVLDEEMLKLALFHWTRTAPTEIDRRAAVLLAWWETAQAAQFPWPTALAALGEMLAT